MDVTERPRNWAARVHRFVREQRLAEAERCDICAQTLPPRHAHLVEPEKHRLLCVCQGCDTLLGDRHDRKYLRVPRDARRLEGFRLSDAEWEALAIPIGLAFFFYSTPEGRILALYPGPAGPTESLLSLEAWSGLVTHNPTLADLEPDVEALLVNRLGGAKDYYAVPIDRCYELVGLIRTHWAGISGGPMATKAIGGFFASLRGIHDGGTATGGTPNGSGLARHG